MALPANNASFQKGNFSGFSTKGLCGVLPRFDAGFDDRPWMMERASGENFAILDGCGLRELSGNWDIGPDGSRQSTNPKPTNLFDKIHIRHGNGYITSGYGSWLRCSLDLPVAGRIRFVWAFATTTPRFTANACFAAFRFLPDGKEPKANRDNFVIAPSTTDLVRVTDQLVVLDRMRLANDGLTVWRETEVQWAGSKPFDGKVEWLVASGQYIDTPGIQPNAAVAKCFPASLMLDHVRLT